MRKYLMLIAVIFILMSVAQAQTTAYGIAGGGIKISKSATPEFMAVGGFDVNVVDSGWNVFNRTQYFYTDASDNAKEMQAISTYLMVRKNIYASFFAEVGSGLMYSIEAGPDDALSGFRAGLGLTLFNAVSLSVNGDYIPIKDEPDVIMAYLSVSLKK